MTDPFIDPAAKRPRRPAGLTAARMAALGEAGRRMKIDPEALLRSMLREVVAHHVMRGLALEHPRQMHWRIELNLARADLVRLLTARPDLRPLVPATMWAQWPTALASAKGATGCTDVDEAALLRTEVLHEALGDTAWGMVTKALLGQLDKALP